MKKEKVIFREYRKEDREELENIIEKRGIMINFVVLKLLEKWLELIWLIV